MLMSLAHGNVEYVLSPRDWREQHVVEATTLLAGLLHLWLPRAYQAPTPETVRDCTET